MTKQKYFFSILCISLFLLIVFDAFPLINNTSVAASTADISDGQYYIKNVQSKSYVDIQNQTMANGTPIHQWSYHGHWTQRWEFELQSNGYHTISSVVSGTKYYLSVQNNSSADGTPIVLKSGTITNDMLWAVTQTSLGYYKITPKVGESLNRIMAVTYNSNQSTNGLLIKSFTYSNDGHRSDEWILLPALRHLTPSHYYDTGFNVRHSEASGSYLVETCQNKSSERLLSNFGLYSSPTYESFQSVSDTCKFSQFGIISAANLDALTCPHSSDCQSFSKMITNLVSREGAGNYTTTKNLWTGHKISGHGRASYTSTYQAVLLTPYTTENKSLTEKIDILSYAIFHETSHAIGAKDHYCNKTATTPCTNSICDICVYGRDKVRECVMGICLVLDDYSDDDLYCVECVIRIRNHIRNNL